MRTALLLPAGTLLLAFLVILIGRGVNAQAYKIRSARGVQRAEYITIGGIEQYVQTRGQDRENPVILVLHGGPGSSMSSYSYAWQAALEEAYTIVHWDQRGCGNTYYRRPDAEKPTLDLLLADLDELVDHIRGAYGKETVILLGHSWGTFLGGIYAKAHPEKLSAFISVSQMLDFKQSEAESAEEAIRTARGAGRQEDGERIAEGLAAVLACRTFGWPEAAALMKLRQRKEKYLPPQYGGRMGTLRLFSPYMTLRDLRWMLRPDKLIESNGALYRDLLSHSMYDYGPDYEVPLILVAGEWDRTTPYGMARRYFDSVSAPGKVFVTMEKTGHIPFVERPQACAQALLNALTAGNQ